MLGKNKCVFVSRMTTEASDCHFWLTHTKQHSAIIKNASGSHDAKTSKLRL